MRHLLFLLILILSTVIVKAQIDVPAIYRKIDKYYATGNYEEGLKFLASNMKVYEDRNQTVDSVYAFYVNEMAMMYTTINEFDKAEPLFLKAIQIDEQLHGPTGEQTLIDLGNLGEMYRLTGRLDKTLTIYTKITAVYSKVIRDTTGYYNFLNSLGCLYSDMGIISEAEKCHRQTLDYRIRTNDTTVVHSYRNLGYVLKAKGDFAGAESCYLKMIAIDKKYYGERHPEIALDLSNLAGLYMQMGSLGKAENCVKKAIAIFDLYPGNFIVDRIYPTIRLADIYIDQGENEKAGILLNEALKVIGKQISVDHSIHISTHQMLAEIAVSEGQLQEAKNLLTEAIKLQSGLNSSHNLFYSLFFQMYKLYALEGRPDSAAWWLDKAIINAKMNLAPYHPNLIKSLSSKGALLSSRGKSIAAMTYFNQAQKLQEETSNNYFGFMSESQKSDFYNDMTRNNSRFLAFACRYHGEFPDAAGQAFDMQLNSKGLILGSLVKLKQQINNSPNQEKIFNEWVGNKERLARMLYSGNPDNSRKMDSIIEVSDGLEKKLGESSRAFLDFMHDRDIVSWQQVREKLKSDEAFVMFIRFSSDDLKRDVSVKYIALILTKEAKNGPALLFMPQGDKFDDAFLSGYLDDIKKGQRTGAVYADNKAYLRFWKPVEDLLSGKRTIYIMPDGIYHRINPGALKVTDDEYLCDRHSLIMINSIADFKLTDKVPRLKSGRAALFGDPEFASNPARSFMPALTDSGKKEVELHKLAGTRTEILTVDSILRNNGWQTNVYMGSKATESNLKQLRDPGIIILATHGFYGDNSIPGLRPDKAGLRSGPAPMAASPLTGAMLRSGVYLAGAQNTLNNNDRSVLGTDDGILTSYEISNLSFKDLNLVVLSSCESGAGKITGEGTYGLQRAWRISGADNILVSLWDIDDNATQLFIRKFMEFHVSGHSIRQSLAETQNYLRTKTIYNHPYYWGAFICVGNEPADGGSASPTLLIFIVLASSLIMVSIIIAVRRRNRIKTI